MTESERRRRRQGAQFGAITRGREKVRKRLIAALTAAGDPDCADYSLDDLGELVDEAQAALEALAGREGALVWAGVNRLRTIKRAAAADVEPTSH